MQFLLDDSVFGQPNVSAKLITLFTLAAQSYRHVILPHNPQSQSYTMWLNTLPNEIKADIEMFVDTSFRVATASNFLKILTVIDQNSPYPVQLGISLDTALIHAQEPFRLYVENGRNDRQFLLSYTTPDQRERLTRLETLRGLTFVHSGGITEMLAKIQADISTNVARPEYSWALFDSDALEPGKPSGQSQKLSSACRALGVRQTQLQRRAIENYIPRNSLRSWTYLGRKKEESGAR